MEITTRDVLKAAVRLRNQANGRGPILGFTFPGEFHSVTYDFNEKKAWEQEIAQFTIEEFVKCLNEVTDERGVQ